VSQSDAVRELMEADRWIERVSAQRNHLPELEELRGVEEELRSLVKALHEADEALSPIERAYDDAAKEAQRLRARASALTTTLASSTANARELAALQTELDHVQALLGQSEDRELEFLLALEPLQEVVTLVKERAQPGIARRATLQSTIAELQRTLDEELVSLRVQRQQKASNVASELLTRYDMALARVGTSGAAQVNAGRCDGCRIALSPLDLDRWKSQPDDVFMACPECGRLLLA